MKKNMVIGISACAIAVMLYQLGGKERQPINAAIPDSPSVAVSDAFDGQWEGERFDTSGDKVCSPTRVVGSIENGEVTITLVYNNTLLRGWISAEGELELYTDSPRWGYRFTGLANNDRIDGGWKVTNAPCNGEWYIERKV